MTSPDEAFPVSAEAHLAESKRVLLDEIDTQLGELALYATGTIYTRETSTSSDAEEGFGTLEIAIKEKMGLYPERELTLILPSPKEGRTPATQTASLSQKAGEQWQFWLPMGGSEASLKGLLESDDLPEGIAKLVSLLAAAAHDEGASYGNITITHEQSAALWQGISDSLEADGTPASYDYHYETALQGKNAIVSARGVVASADGTKAPEGTLGYTSANVHVPGDFNFRRQYLTGQVSEVFDDETTHLKDEDLPALTDEDRNKHPYVVLRTNFGMPADADPQTLPFKVTSATVGGPVMTSHTAFTETEAEAQEIADGWYRRDLANAKLNYEVTPERLQRVKAVMHKVLDQARTKALSEPNH